MADVLLFVKKLAASGFRVVMESPKPKPVNATKTSKMGNNRFLSFRKN